MDGNRNAIQIDGWSDPSSERMYAAQWPDDPACREQYRLGEQCGGCSFLAPLNADWGLCLHSGSRHHLETVFEHFTCPAYIAEGWGPHSFSSDREQHCCCGGTAPEKI